VTMLLTPVLLPILPYRIPREAPPEAHFFNRVMMGFIERLEVQWKWLIFAGVAVSIVFSVTGIRRLDVDTNIVKQMKPNSPLAVATRFIDQNITGVYTLGFVLRPRDGKKVDDPRVLEQIDAFKSFLESMPEIAKVNSISTLIKRIHEVREESSEAYRIPEDPKLLEEYFAGIMKNANSEISSLVSPDLREVNVQARMRAVGTKEGAAVEDAIRVYLGDVIARDFDWHMTGNVVLLGRMSKDLVESQTRSFCFAFLTTLALIAIIFGSLRLGLLAAIPSLLPIAMVYGMMGYLKIELSSSTAMISSIVLGIVVDSSIHFLHRYRHEFNHREHYLQALHHTYRHVGQSLYVSTLILIAGFATSIFGGFRPTIYFGVLTSLAIFLALICTLLVLPAFTVLVKPFGRARGFRRGKRSAPRKKA